MPYNSQVPKVLEAFERGEKAKAGAFRTDGSYLRTYNVILAIRTDGKIEFNDTLWNRYSVTSSRHQKATREFFGLPESLEDAKQRYAIRETN